MSKFKSNRRFLLAVAAASAVACAASFYVGYHTNKVVASAPQEEVDAPRTPLPAGPRRYQ